MLGTAYSFRQLAWNEILTVGSASLGDKLHVPSAFWLTNRLKRAFRPGAPADALAKVVDRLVERSAGQVEIGDGLVDQVDEERGLGRSPMARPLDRPRRVEAPARAWSGRRSVLQRPTLTSR